MVRKKQSQVLKRVEVDDECVFLAVLKEKVSVSEPELSMPVFY